MPGPSSPATFQRPDLGQTFEEFDLAAALAGFVGLQVLPSMPVGLQTSSFSRIPAEALLAERDTKRAPGGGYSRQEWEFEQDSYATSEFGAEEVLDDRERAIYSYTIDFERINALRARDAVLRDMEKRIAAAVFDTTVFTGSLTTAVATEWDIQAMADPVADVLAAVSSVKASCGMLPNAVLMSDKVFRNLQKVDSIIQRIKYSGLDDPKQVTKQALATLFLVDEVIVAGSSANVRNSANPGQNPTFADLWDDEFCLVARLAKTQDLREPALGRTFWFTGDGAGEQGVLEQYRDERRRSDVIRFRTDYQEKIIYPQCGHLLTNITQP